MSTMNLFQMSSSKGGLPVRRCNDLLHGNVRCGPAMNWNWVTTEVAATKDHGCHCQLGEKAPRTDDTNCRPAFGV